MAGGREAAVQSGLAGAVLAVELAKDQALALLRDAERLGLGDVEALGGLVGGWDGVGAVGDGAVAVALAEAEDEAAVEKGVGAVGGGGGVGRDRVAEGSGGGEAGEEEDAGELHVG